MDEEIREFKENVDAWIRQITGKISEIDELPQIVEENVGNTEHNYELIHELKGQLDDLKQELKMLKLMQILMLRPDLRKNI